MKLIVGLGNPGLDYQNTRHNAGFMVVDRLAERHGAGVRAKGRWNASVLEVPMPGAGKALLMKPNTYMNLSGRPVAEAVRFYKLSMQEDVLVVTDDVALDPGVIRMRTGGGAGGHNGLKDINKLLSTQDYPRLRIGVGKSPSFMDQADYVLGKFTEADMAAVGPALDRAADACEAFCAAGAEDAMNRFNAAPTGWGSKPNTDNAAEADTAGTDIDPGWLEGNR